MRPNVSADKKLQPWIVEQSEEIEDYRIFKLKREAARTEDGSKRGEFYVLDSPNWVNVVPVTMDGQIVFVRQYRHGSRTISLETPAGLAEPDEAVEAAAARELREETGYSAQSFTVLGSSYANPAFMNNRYTALLAEGVTLTDPTAFDEHEELEIELIPTEKVPELIATGAIENSFSLLSLSWYLLHSHGILAAPQ
jgi:8-oxo-dGTP pyrophosphatase MutT (NUDIX family)